MAKAKESESKQEREAHDGPSAVLLEVRLPSGEVWGQIMAPFKVFSTGSDGYYANGKLIDPKSGQKYQVGCNIIRIGSKK